jgi:hypothetical protein
LRNRVKVLALTRDDPSERDEEAAIFGWGFAHPRLWEQYADNHRGVCLCLDRETLIEKATHTVRHQGKLEHDPVTYVDAAIATEARTIIMNNIRDQSVSQTFDEHVKTHLHELFFTKLKDWESEMAYRLALPTDDDLPVFVGIREALRAVVLGERVSDVYLPAVAKPCEEQAVPIFKIRWPYGRPRLEPKDVVRES